MSGASTFSGKRVVAFYRTHNDDLLLRITEKSSDIFRHF